MPSETPSPSVNPLTGRAYSSRFYKLKKCRDGLPVTDFLPDLFESLSKSQVLIVEGETGSGKTTQIPQALLLRDLDVIRSSGQTICCTQPRRVAAMSVARRVSEEMDVELKAEVGYTIRFEDCTSESTLLTYMTDGMLLREAMQDGDLRRYSYIILDEAHERTLATDVLMGLLKSVLSRRPDLHLIVMSATIDTHRFKSYFDDCPLISVPGRLYPVDIFYVREPERDYVEAAVRTIVQIHLFESPGDILAFFTGEEEILDVCAQIEEESRSFAAGTPPLKAIPLFSTLPTHQQQEIFSDPPVGRDGQLGRKVIVSTNIAETSLTIDGIVYVVDPGFSKQKLYNPRVRVESLLVSSISKASAKQRAGRAGRTRPGKCFRMYTEQSYHLDLQDQTYPEILRSNLSNVVLDLKKLGIDDVAHFDFMDPPAPETMMRALEQLYFIGALDDEGDLTSDGKLMADLPLEPVLSKLILSSRDYRCTSEMLTIVAMLSVPPPFMRPKDHGFEADKCKANFAHGDSDHITLLNVFNAFLESHRNPRWCYDNYINNRPMNQAYNIRCQLERSCRKMGLDVAPAPVTNELHVNLKKCLVAAFFMQVTHTDRVGKGLYLTLKDRQSVKIHPSSVISYAPPFVLYNEFVLTKSNYIRVCTAIEGVWLFEIAPHYYDLASFNPNTDIYQELVRLQAEAARAAR